MATDSPATKIARRIAALYAVVGLLWILTSDAAVSVVARNPDELLTWQLLKGWAFVLVTAAILYSIIHHYLSEYHRKESHFRALVEASSSNVWVADAKGTEFASTSMYQNTTGVDPAQSEAAAWVDVLHPDDYQRVMALWRQSLASGAKFETEFRMRSADGEYRHYQCRAVPIREGGKIRQWIGQTVDINDRMTALLELKRSEANLRLAVRGGKLGLWGVDMASNEVTLSPQWRAQLGFDKDEALDASADFFFSLLHPDDAAAVTREWQRALASAPHDFVADYRMRHRNGGYRWIHSEASFFTDEQGELTQVLGTHLDITDIKESQEQLRYLATHDDLLGLPNRRRQKEKLEAFCREARARQEKVGLVHLNLDNFKLVTNNYGNRWGDELLRACANRVASIVPPANFLCRPGSDELAVIVTDRSGGADSHRFATQVHGLFRSPFKIFDHELFITSTIGVAVFPDDARDPDDLLRKAQAALAHGKLLGRNRIQYFDEDIERRSARTLKIQNSLRAALAHNQLDIALQPQYNIQTREPQGFEALVRWHDSALGTVSPAEFIPVAERSGLIDQLGMFVLERSCQQLASWAEQNLSGACIALNISAGQLHHPNFVRDMIAMIRKYGVKPEQLELEITETAIMADLESSMSSLRQLSAAGFHLAIDDFGTGYSSFAYLRLLTVQTLKIDKSFVDQIGKGEADDMIVTAIIALAHNLHLRVIAEGVETAEQLAFLKEHGCDAAQGYYLCKPVSAAEATNLLWQN